MRQKKSFGIYFDKMNDYYIRTNNIQQLLHLHSSRGRLRPSFVETTRLNKVGGQMRKFLSFPVRLKSIA